VRSLDFSQQDLTAVPSAIAHDVQALSFYRRSISPEIARLTRLHLFA